MEGGRRRARGSVLEEPTTPTRSVLCGKRGCTQSMLRKSLFLGQKSRNCRKKADGVVGGGGRQGRKGEAGAGVGGGGEKGLQTRRGGGNT